MKANLLALLTTLLITHLSLSARIVEVGKSPVKIAEGESFKMLLVWSDGSSYHSRGHIEWIVEIDDVNTTSTIAHAYDDKNGPINFPGTIIDGPGWIKGYEAGLGTNYYTVTYATVEILPTSEMQKYLPGGGGSSSSSSASGEQKNVTVIPENTPSNVQITLEQSTDLVNWSVVQPGSFAPSTTKRFFRIRSEQE